MADVCLLGNTVTIHFICQFFVPKQTTNNGPRCPQPHTTRSDMGGFLFFQNLWHSVTHSISVNFFSRKTSLFPETIRFHWKITFTMALAKQKIGSHLIWSTLFSIEHKKCSTTIHCAHNVTQCAKYRSKANS